MPMQTPRPTKTVTRPIDWIWIMCPQKVELISKIDFRHCHPSLVYINFDRHACGSGLVESILFDHELVFFLCQPGLSHEVRIAEQIGYPHRNFLFDQKDHLLAIVNNRGRDAYR